MHIFLPARRKSVLHILLIIITVIVSYLRNCRGVQQWWNIVILLNGGTKSDGRFRGHGQVELKKKKYLIIDDVKIVKKCESIVASRTIAIDEMLLLTKLRAIDNEWNNEIGKDCDDKAI